MLDLAEKVVTMRVSLCIIYTKEVKISSTKPYCFYFINFTGTDVQSLSSRLSTFSMETTRSEQQEYYQLTSCRGKASSDQSSDYEDHDLPLPVGKFFCSCPSPHICFLSVFFWYFIIQRNQFLFNLIKFI